MSELIYMMEEESDSVTLSLWKNLYDRSYKPLHLHEMDNKTVVYLLKKRNIRSFTY